MRKSLFVAPFASTIRMSLMALLIGVFAILWATHSGFSSVARDKQRLIDHYTQALILAERLRLNVAKETEVAQLFVLTGDRLFYQAVLDRRHQFFDFVALMRKTIDDPEELRLINKVSETYQLHSERGDQGLLRRLHGQSLEQVHHYMHANTRKLLEDEYADLERLTTQLSANLKAANHDSSLNSQQILKRLTVLSALVIVTCLIIAFLVLRALRTKARFEDEQRAVLEKTKQLARARKEAVEVVAHDLGNPLTGLLLTLQMMEKKLRIPGASLLSVKNDIEKCRRSGTNMKDLIVNLLDQTKIESGSLKISACVQDLSKLVADVVGVFDALIAEKSIRLRVSGEAGLISFDAFYIHQVLSNILSNAIKFTPSGGTIEIGVSRSLSYAEVWVCDTGPGIEKENCAHIFDRFWKSNMKRRSGTGLGLAIAKGLVEAHGGRIWVESQMGVGTKMAFRLPVAPGEGPVLLNN